MAATLINTLREAGLNPRRQDETTARSWKPLLISCFGNNKYHFCLARDSCLTQIIHSYFRWKQPLVLHEEKM